MNDTELCKSYRDGIDYKICRLETKIDANRVLFEAKMNEIEKAIQVASQILNHRLDKENNIREEMREQIQNFLTKAEYDIRHKNMEEKINSVLRETSKLDGRMISIIFVIPIVVSIIMMIIFHVAK